ncbi:hypothetical protein [Runella zeae]|uniref:hypothetical protein n=1 Tax=Runella zeae TaxID=94255 RepID=UPI00286E8853|nr:hypothetical protein [Runella zeae]
MSFLCGLALYWDWMVLCGTKSGAVTLMKDLITAHINEPSQLEKLYRSNKAVFKRAFSSVYPELKGNTAADVWHERLNYDSDDIQWGTGQDLALVVGASLVAGVIAKIPAFTQLNEEFFYTRNIGFIIFPLLTAYFAWKNKVSTKTVAMLAGVFLIGAIFINSLPNNPTSDTLTLSCIHLVLLLWSILGFAFVGSSNNSEKRLGYLKYNGDLVVMTTLIVISGGILSAITVGLFSLINLDIGKFYFENIGVFGLAAAPLVGTYLTQTNPQLVGKVSPVIAKIFSPLVLVMLTVYLGAIVYSGKDPYNNREFLMVFNALLIGVMALIFFSVAETSKTFHNRAQVWVLFLLAMLTIVVNGVALSAILFRISEWGITPNRTAVLGGNLLILVNLLLVMIQLSKVLTQKATLVDVGKTIAIYLPIYSLWTLIVTFLFPFLFGFK